MVRCLWNHAFAKFDGFWNYYVLCVSWIREVVFFVKSLCLHLCEVTKLRIKCISRIRNIAIFWCDKINIVMNLWNCDLCERCECSYLLFAKIQIFKLLWFIHIVVFWRLRVSAFDIFVSSRILLFMNFRHHYFSKKLKFVHFLILWSHEFCIVVNSRNGCSYEGCDFLHVLSSWNHDNCIFNEFAKSMCFTFVGILLCGIQIELICGDTNGLSI
jgi:hypothetical protein